MARIARVVVPGYPHHVTQRGSRRQPTFFQPSDYQLYLEIMADYCRRYDVEIWAYCLMPNHIHLVAVPSDPTGLSRAIGSAHRRYAMRINARKAWSGHLWQERFSSFVMDESYLLAAVRYVEMNPVRAGFVGCPGDYAWSSAAAHLEGRDDDLVKVAPMLDRVDSWKMFLETDVHETDGDMQRATRTGRPLGRAEFIVGIEKVLGRAVRPQKTGRKKMR